MSRESRDASLRDMHLIQFRRNLSREWSMLSMVEATTQPAVERVATALLELQALERQSVFANLLSASSSAVSMADLNCPSMGFVPVGQAMLLSSHGHSNLVSPEVREYIRFQEFNKLQRQQLMLQQHQRNQLAMSSSSALYPLSKSAMSMYPTIRSSNNHAPPPPTMMTLGERAMVSTPVHDGMEQDEVPVCLPILLARKEDALKVSSHQVLLRHQIEAFQATEDDISTHMRGRNKAVVLGQVGIRCRHCTRLPILGRQKGSTYFPATTLGLYQAAQNMNTSHMQSGLCQGMPRALKEQLIQVMANKVTSAGAGRPYWASTAKKMGLVDTEDGIFFCRQLPKGVRLLTDSDHVVSASSKKRAAAGGAVTAVSAKKSPDL